MQTEWTRRTCMHGVTENLDDHPCPLCRELAILYGKDMSGDKTYLFTKDPTGNRTQLFTRDLTAQKEPDPEDKWKDERADYRGTLAFIAVIGDEYDKSWGSEVAYLRGKILALQNVAKKTLDKYKGESIPKEPDPAIQALEAIKGPTENEMAEANVPAYLSDEDISPEEPLPTPDIWLQDDEETGKADCGCLLEFDGDGDPFFIYCPMHKAAADTLAILKDIISLDEQFPGHPGPK